MPPWVDFEPFIISGLALGGVFAMSGVGLVVLYRATGVLYLAFGAVGATGRADRLAADPGGTRRAGSAGSACVAAAGGAVTLGYGLLFGPALAKRDPLSRRWRPSGCCSSCTA